MQNARSKQREQNIEVRAEEQHQANYEDHHQDRRRFPDIVHTLAQTLPGLLSLVRVGVWKRLGMQLARVDECQTCNHRQKTERVEQKEHAYAAGGNDDATNARTYNARQRRERGVQGNGVAQIIASDQFDDKRLPRWFIQAVGESQQQCQDIDMPELNGTCGDQYPEQQS